MGDLLYRMGDSYIVWGFPYNMGDSGMVIGYEIDFW